MKSTCIACAIAFGCTIPFACVYAQAPANPLEFRSLLVPAAGGWIAPDTNFGGITFDLNYDAERSVANGEWQIQDNGIAKVVFFQADLLYRSQQAYEDSGIFATLDSPTFTFSGRADYNDPVYGGGGTLQLTGRNIRIEFHSSREATFIDNPGQPDERQFAIVGTLRGLPLIAPRDFSGDWVVVGRSERGVDNHYDGVAKLVLTSISLGPTRVVTYPEVAQPMPLPQAEARVYAVSCTSLEPETGYSACTTWDDFAATCIVNGGGDPGYDDPGYGCVEGVSETLLWINPDETGSLAHVTLEADGTRVFYNLGEPYPLAFGDNDRVTIRRYAEASATEEGFLAEGYLHSVPADFMQQ